MGTILIVAGFIMAGAAGVVLALQAAQGNIQPGDAALGAGLVFVPLAGIITIGVYLRVRGHTRIEPESAVEKQRRMVDLLNERGQVSIHEMADALEVDETQLYDLIDQLARLDIFPGRVDRDASMIYKQEQEDNLR